MTTIRSLALVLIACAAAMSGCAAKLISADGQNVVVRARKADLAGATEIADAQCFKRGLRARAVSKLSDEQFGFECVR